MSKSVKPHIKFRNLAFRKQGGFCYYCNFPMWEKDIAGFSSRYNLSLRQANQFKCTAEHLLARQDGGKDVEDNIVAACLACNHKRHRGKRKVVPEPQEYIELIQQRLEQGRWHPFYPTLNGKESN
tara:strand:+ start:670 stop:1044 length:375 start_codon:yes stop_codon:yes gene_type:complete